MPTKTASVSPEALRQARKQRHISQRELGRRVAKRLGQDNAAARALQVRLSRLERGDEISETNRELVEALAEELAVGVGDLAEPPVWIWIKLIGARPGIVELAMRFPVYTSPELAYEARDWLAHASEGRFTPFQDAQLVPMRFHALAQDTLDANYPDLSEPERRLLIAVDPSPEGDLSYLAGLNAVLDDGFRDDEAVDVVVEDLNKFGLSGEVIQLHQLALRRLALAPPEYPELVETWRRREERLFELVERDLEIRRAEREKTLANVLAKG
jgi:transcriptional regulator with XRE-family HTH domain